MQANKFKNSYPAQLRFATGQMYVLTKIQLYFYTKRLKGIFVALKRKKLREEQLPRGPNFSSDN